MAKNRNESRAAAARAAARAEIVRRMTTSGGPRRGLCGKVRYPTRKAAKRAARRLADSGEDNARSPHVVMTPYYCRDCLAFHFGHQARRREGDD